MDITKIKAVVFDCDGVMFDTAQANRRFYDEILDAFGKPPLNEEQFVNVHMMTVTEAIAYLFPEKEDLTVVWERLKTIGYHKFIKYMKMETGLKSLLSGLKKNGFIRGIATNRTNTMEKVLADFGLESGFDVVMTAAKVNRPKPDPEQLHKIMDIYSLNPDQILFVGDSDYDRIAAERAGTWFAAFKSLKLKADLHVSAMKDLAAALNINEQKS
jgi:phosphoglycolate phosphatase